MANRNIKKDLDLHQLSSGRGGALSTEHIIKNNMVSKQ